MKKTLLILILVLLCACQKVSRHTVTTKVLSVEKQVKTSGNEKRISTDIYWMVVTDKGTYHVTTEGYWACAKAIALQPDSTYVLTIDGWFSSPFWGVYPYIVNVDKP